LDCGLELQVHEHLLGQNVDKMTLLEFKARGFYGLTYKVEDSNGKRFALKLISKATYDKYDKDFFHEAEAYAKLPNHPCIATYVRVGQWPLTVHDVDLIFYFILSEWVPGCSLKDFMKSSELQPWEIYLLARDLLTAIQAFEEVNLWHNDLHEENVLVSELSGSQQRALQRENNKIFKVVDIGSARFRSEFNLGDINDLNYVGYHLNEAYSHASTRIHTYTKEDQNFLKMLPAFCARLVDENPSRRFKNADAALDEIEKVWKSSRSIHIEASQVLEDPFGLINALDIRSPKLIREMFSEKFRYFSRIDSMDNHSIIVTGPRGCGKTMILKRMSFETNFIPNVDGPLSALEKIKYIGLFISARVEFGNLLVAIRNPKWINDPDSVGLYFNALITLALIDIMYRLSEAEVAKATDLQPIIDFIIDRLKIPLCDLYHCRSHVVKICQKIVTQDDLNSGIPDSFNATPRYLDDLVDVFTGTIPPFRGKEIVMLVDDLSWPRIPDSIMTILAPFLFNTGSKYKIRVSAHSEGIVTRDLAGEDYKDNRDFTEINLGREYYILSENYDVCRKGFDDLMDRRFRLAGKGSFPGLETVLGKGDELKHLGAVIKLFFEQKKLRSLRYWGAHVFVKLCSGDFSYLVEILGFMSERGKDKEYAIAKDVQNNVIRNYARTQLRLLRDIKTTAVSSLYDIGLTFGFISKAKLLKEQKEYLRIEIETKELTDDLWEAIRELLSSGLFVDGGYSNTSSGVPARRLIFRRIYTPAFPTTVNNRNSFSMRKNSFMSFVKMPRQHYQSTLSKNGFPPDEIQQFEQLDMFND
jgi:hypothetical protein